MSKESAAVPQMPQIKLSDTKVVACECGSEIFNSGITLRGVSALLTGTGKDEVIPTQVIYCVKCLKKYEPPKAPEPSSIIT